VREAAETKHGIQINVLPFRWLIGSCFLVNLSIQLKQEESHQMFDHGVILTAHMQYGIFLIDTLEWITNKKMHKKSFVKHIVISFYYHINPINLSRYRGQGRYKVNEFTVHSSYAYLSSSHITMLGFIWFTCMRHNHILVPQDWVF